jgi:hypothetical protein
MWLFKHGCKMKLDMPRTTLKGRILIYIGALADFNSFWGSFRRAWKQEFAAASLERPIYILIDRGHLLLKIAPNPAILCRASS